MHDIHHKFIVFTRDRVGKPTVSPTTPSLRVETTYRIDIIN